MGMMSYSFRSDWWPCGRKYVRALAVAVGCLCWVCRSGETASGEGQGASASSRGVPFALPSQLTPGVSRILAAAESEQAFSYSGRASIRVWSYPTASRAEADLAAASGVLGRELTAEESASLANIRACVHVEAGWSTLWLPVGSTVVEVRVPSAAADLPALLKIGEQLCVRYEARQRELFQTPEASIYTFLDSVSRNDAPGVRECFVRDSTSSGKLAYGLLQYTVARLPALRVRAGGVGQASPEAEAARLELAVAEVAMESASDAWVQLTAQENHAIGRTLSCVVLGANLSGWKPDADSLWLRLRSINGAWRIDLAATLRHRFVRPGHEEAQPETATDDAPEAGEAGTDAERVPAASRPAATGAGPKRDALPQRSQSAPRAGRSRARQQNASTRNVSGRRPAVSPKVRPATKARSLAVAKGTQRGAARQRRSPGDVRPEIQPRQSARSVQQSVAGVPNPATLVRPAVVDQIRKQAPTPGGQRVARGPAASSRGPGQSRPRQPLPIPESVVADLPQPRPLDVPPAEAAGRGRAQVQPAGRRAADTSRSPLLDLVRDRGADGARPDPQAGVAALTGELLGMEETAAMAPADANALLAQTRALAGEDVQPGMTPDDMAALRDAAGVIEQLLPEAMAAVPEAAEALKAELAERGVGDVIATALDGPDDEAPSDAGTAPESKDGLRDEQQETAAPEEGQEEAEPRQLPKETAPAVEVEAADVEEAGDKEKTTEPEGPSLFRVALDLIADALTHKTTAIGGVAALALLMLVPCRPAIGRALVGVGVRPLGYQVIGRGQVRMRFPSDTPVSVEIRHKFSDEAYSFTGPRMGQIIVSKLEMAPYILEMTFPGEVVVNVELYHDPDWAHEEVVIEYSERKPEVRLNYLKNGVETGDGLTLDLNALPGAPYRIGKV